MSTLRALRCVGCLALALGVGAGCSLTSRETARQLEHREVVVGGGLDLPGDDFDPRLSAYGKVGVGDKADLGLQGGFAFGLANLGASARYYPTRWLTLSLQTEAIFVVDNTANYGVGNDTYTAGIVVTPRISTAVRGKMPVYLGLQANVLSGWAYQNNRSDARFGLEGALAGPFIGLEGTIFAGLSAQMELIVLPLTITEEGPFLFIGGDVVIIPMQWSVGLNYRFGGEPKAVRAMEPTEAPPPVQPAPPAEPEPPAELEPPAEPEPAPEYDEGGVPIY